MMDLSTISNATAFPSITGTCGCSPTGSDGGSVLEMLARLLAESMLNEDGSIKEGSKLAELLGKFMDEHADKYGNPGQYGKSWQDALTSGHNKVDLNVLMQVLADMIGEKSGGNSFADELFSPGTSHSPFAGAADAQNLFGGSTGLPFGGESPLSNLPSGQPGTGGSDLISQLMQFLSTLGSEALGGLLSKDGKGGATFSSDDMDILKQVALYMDQNPDVFGKPHDANGKVSSWVDELGEDNYLNAEETALFEKAIGNIDQEMASFATVGNGSSQTGGLFGDLDLSSLKPSDVSLNMGASTAAFNIMAQLYGQSV